MPRLLALALLFLTWSAPALAAVHPLDLTPRTAVVSAFPPELATLKAALSQPQEYESGGVVFTTGTLEGRPVVLFLSGVSMVNAAMTTQLAVDRFNVRRIVFSGIAGGLDPALDVGDVVVPDQWGQDIEMAFARETPDGFSPPGGETFGWPNYGMMYPRAVGAFRTPGQVERRMWFPVDADLLALARKVAPEITLNRCVDRQCLDKAPKVVVGGAGASGPVFLDNAAYRQYVFATWKARVHDMESAAVAQVAWANSTPFIAFRSLSDLAGAESGHNQFPVFFRLASENSALVVRRFVAALPD